MNQLITTYNGGFPFQLDDLRFLDNAQREAFLGIIKAMVGNQKAAILAGCKIASNDGTTIHVNEGYVFLNNEIFYAPAQDLPVITSGSYYWVPDITYDATGDKSFDGVIQHTYEIRRAKCQSSTTVLGDGLVLGVSEWVSIDLTTDNVTLYGGTLSINSGQLKYKIINNMIFILLKLNFSVTSSNGIQTHLTIALPPELMNIDQAGNQISGLSGFGATVFDTTQKINFQLQIVQAGLSLEKGDAIGNGDYTIVGQLFGENL